MPALLTSASIDLKRDSAVSTTRAAVAGSPMWPSTRATWSEAATSVDWVIFRELATTLKPRSRKPLTIPAPIPCDAPVTMAVFRWPFMVVYLEKRLATKFMVLHPISRDRRHPCGFWTGLYSIRLSNGRRFPNRDLPIYGRDSHTSRGWLDGPRADVDRDRNGLSWRPGRRES